MLNLLRCARAGDSPHSVTLYFPNSSRIRYVHLDKRTSALTIRTQTFYLICTFDGVSIKGGSYRWLDKYAMENVPIPRNPPTDERTSSLIKARDDDVSKHRQR